MKKNTASQAHKMSMILLSVFLFPLLLSAFSTQDVSAKYALAGTLKPTLTRTATKTIKPPTRTPTKPRTVTRTVTRTATRTVTKASTSTKTRTATITLIPPRTRTPMPTYTQRLTLTPTKSATPTLTPTDTDTPTLTPTETETLTPTPTATLYTETELDEFDASSLSAAWEWYTPALGPTYSLSAAPGLLRMSLPAGRGYEHWVNEDNAPQLRRTDLGDRDWAIETRLEAISGGADAGYLAGLEVGFDQYDQVWMGMGQDGLLNTTRIGVDSPETVPQTLPIIMRVEKHGENYIFKYRHDPSEAWSEMASKNYPGVPVYVGLIGRVFAAGSQQMDIDWAYFQLERYPSAPSTLTPSPTATLTPTETETATPTETETPTPTSSLTFTPTRTKTITPTNTITLTKSMTITRTSTWTMTPSKTWTPTWTPTSTATITPTFTSTSTLTPTPSPSIFHEPVNYPAEAAGVAVVVGDFNNDGLQDTAMTIGGSKLLVYLQNSDGSLPLTPVSYSMGFYYPFSMAVGDLNHDGRQDIVVAMSATGIGVFLQQANGTLADMATYATSSDSPSDVVVGDLNHDGLDDVAVANSSAGRSYIDVFTQNAAGGLSPKVSYLAPEEGSALAIGDFNGDGRNDLVETNDAVFNQSMNPSVYLQNSDGTLALPYTLSCSNCGYAYAVGAGNVSVDGRTDIVASYSIGDSSSIAIFTQVGDGVFSSPVLYSVNGFPESVKFSDVNRDGLTDVITLNSIAWNSTDGSTITSVNVYLAQNDGTLAGPLSYPASSRYLVPQALAVGDLNHDTRPDLVIAGFSGLVVYYGDYDTILPANTATATPTAPQPTAAATITPTPTITVTPTRTPVATMTPPLADTLTPTPTFTPRCFDC